MVRTLCLLHLVVILAGCKNEKASPPFKPANGKVYFVCRSEYEAPLGHRIVEFEADSVLDWFRREWPDQDMRHAILNPEEKGSWINVNAPEERIPIYNNDAVWNHIEERLEGGGYGMLSIWQAMAQWGESPPETPKQFEQFVASIDYYGGPVAYREHALQLMTDDDEIEISWYLFDEQFIEKHPARTAFLLRDSWLLPEQFSSEAHGEFDTKFVELNSQHSEGEGYTYCIFLSSLDGLTITDISGAFRFSGIRLPELVRHLKSDNVPMIDSEWWKNGKKPLWPNELMLTRAARVSHKLK